MAALHIVVTVLALAGGPDTILEDDPRWDCATMGNRICGTVTVDGWEPDTGDYVGGFN